MLLSPAPSVDLASRQDSAGGPVEPQAGVPAATPLLGAVSSPGSEPCRRCPTNTSTCGAWPGTSSWRRGRTPPQRRTQKLDRYLKWFLFLSQCLLRTFSKGATSPAVKHEFNNLGFNDPWIQQPWIQQSWIQQPSHSTILGINI